MLFFFIYPASYYWEKVEDAKNEVEEEFPDFLRGPWLNTGKVVFR